MANLVNCNPFAKVYSTNIPDEAHGDAVYVTFQRNLKLNTWCILIKTFNFVLEMTQKIQGLSYFSNEVKISSSVRRELDSLHNN